MLFKYVSFRGPEDIDNNIRWFACSKHLISCTKSLPELANLAVEVYLDSFNMCIIFEELD